MNKPDLITFYREQIAKTDTLLNKVTNDTSDYKHITLKVLRDRITAYKEELQRLNPGNLNTYIK